MVSALLFAVVFSSAATAFAPHHRPPLWSERSRVGFKMADNGDAAAPPVAATLGVAAAASGGRRWEQLLAAMRLYHESYGDLCIELGWKVPASPPWPESLWDQKLAKIIYHIDFWQQFVAAVPSRRAELDEIGFLWSRLQPEYNLVLEALMAYRETYGDLLVPTDFVVPREAPWPQSTWTMRLGQRVASIRTRNDHIRKKPQRWFQLDALGFEFQASERSWRRLVAALEHYKLQTGHVLVPKGFVVPTNGTAGETWPEELRGMPLGATVANVRQKRLYLGENPARERQLAELGFVFDVVDYRFEVIMAALAVFKQVHGHVDVRQSFVVPDEPRWPRECVGLPLGRRLTQIRTRGDMVKASSERRGRLSAIGFSWTPKRGRRSGG